MKKGRGNVLKAVVMYIVIVIASMVFVKYLCNKFIASIPQEETLLSKNMANGESGNEKLTIKDITYQEYKDMIGNKMSFVLYVGRDTCSDCKMFHYALDKIDFQSVIYRLNTQEYKDAIDSGEESAQEEYDGFKSDVGYDFIPYVCAVKQGKKYASFAFQFPERISELTEEEKQDYREDMSVRFVKWLVKYQAEIYDADYEVDDNGACGINERCE